ncbi:MAG: Brp/Blh family beta-carotene 15,15'-dioxygenase [Phaeodactylibacter sp.]|nr:Brp/Blh family beta-carotene 15,15'-dioxygenase [Phaeodactylibacter sp.]
MAGRYPLLYRAIQALALFAVLLGVLYPQLMAQWQLFLAVALIVAIGIPHGATDYLIFQHLSRPLWGGRRLARFYLNYVLLMTAYALLWWMLPGLALILFLLLSMYHFGQSNWNYVPFQHKVTEYGAYLLWGAFVVLTPILWHYDASESIIRHLIGAPAPAIAKPWRETICIALLAVNLWLAIYLLIQRKVSFRQFAEEVANLAVLALLFVNTPLLLGFALYFVGWHSLSSVMDQVRFFRERLGRYSLKDYVRNTLPLSLAAIAGLAGMAGIQSSLGMGFNIGAVFIFISVVTLPHMILIDQLYQELPVI